MSTLFGRKYPIGEKREKLLEADIESVNQKDVEEILREARVQWAELKHRRLYYALWMMANLGLRISEAIDVRLTDLTRRLDIQAIAVRTRKKRGVEPELKSIYISNEEVATIRKMIKLVPPGPDGYMFPFSKRTVQYYFDYFRDLAGIDKRLHCHSLRHFASDSLLNVCGRWEVVMLRLRHKPPKNIVTFRYIHPTREQQLTAVNLRKCVY